MSISKKQIQYVAAGILSSIAIFACFPEAFVRRRELRFVGPQRAAPGQTVSYQVTVVDEGNKSPLSGAELTLSQIVENDETELSRGTTNELGAATLTLKVPENLGGNELGLRIRCSGSAIEENVRFALGVSKPKLGRALLTSDKLLYQPGEAIKVRAIYKSNAGTLVKNTAVQFELLNSKNTRIKKVDAKTDDFGVCAAVLTTKKSLPEGRYTLRSLSKRMSAELGSQKVTVKNYRLPSFRAVVIPSARSIAPGDSVQVAVQARRANGAPMRPASYSLKLKDSFGKTLDIQRNANPKSWSSDDSLSLVESFPLGEFGEQRLFIEAELTSESGEVSRAMAVIYASKQALHVTAMAEAGALVPKLSNKVYVQLTGPGGTLVRGQVSMRTEFNDSVEKVETDESGFASFELTSERSIVLHLQGWSEGKSVEAKVDFGVDYSSAGILRCSRYLTDPGAQEEFTLQVNPTLGLSDSDSVLFVIEKDGVLVSQQSALIIAGRVGGKIDIPEEPGVYSLVAIVSSDGEFQKAKRRLIVRPSEKLQLSLETSKDVLSPGEKLQLTARVRGSKEPTMLCIQAVDGALRSLSGLFPFQEKISQFRFGDSLSGRLKRPYAQGALYSQPCSELAQEALSGGEFQTTRRVFGHTAPLNEQRAASLRTSISAIGIDLLWAGFISLLIAAAFTFIVAAYRKSVVIILVLGVGIMGFCCLTFLSPALLSAKSKASRMRPQMNLRRIAMGGEMFKEEFGKVVMGELARPSESEQPNQSVRKYFPETLFYSPLVLTDENGEASVQFAVADSLTTWQIDVLASSRQGTVTHEECTVRTQKDVALEIRAPAFLREGDECQVGVTIRNESDKDKNVLLELKSEAWFELLSPLPQTALTVAQKSSQTHFFAIRVIHAGEHQFQCLARSVGRRSKKKKTSRTSKGGIFDTLIWPMSVRDFDVERARVVTGELSGTGKDTTVDLDLFPSESRSRQVTLKISPNAIIASLDGIERLIREPHGCFEQTSSTTYPNALILSYLKTLPNADQRTVTRARTLLDRGYRRLLGFEVKGGGFSLYGRSPASPWLSAYGLREFLAISKVMKVDEDLIKRTRSFVLSTQKDNGSFGTVEETAYVVAALIDTGYSGPELQRGANFIQTHLLRAISDKRFFRVALIAEALAAWKKAPKALGKALSSLRENSEGLVECRAGNTLSGSYGTYLTLETTAIAARALIRAGRRSSEIVPKLRGILRSRRPTADWGTTQSTIQALMTLIRGKRYLKSGSGTVKVFWNRSLIDQLKFDNEGSSIALDENLFKKLKNGVLRLHPEMKGAANFQVITSFKVPYQSELKRIQQEGRTVLQLKNSLSKASIERGKSTDLIISLSHKGKNTVRSPMIEIPLPGGVEIVEVNRLKKAVLNGKIAHFEAVGSKLVIYLDKLLPGSLFRIRVPLRVTWGGRFQSGIGRAYPYYNPEDGALSEPFELMAR